ncbi:hypothetical protein JOB18_027977 [Solea senegalensis]|uniref:Uncharacterized protein n=1 Tax=Solea senegalensis TaxID=28829 RepID=A0AAV6QU26_SOLSE|nr:hypothetical protein JOB18_027977 [Solea senegalensis]
MSKTPDENRSVRTVKRVLHLETRVSSWYKGILYTHTIKKADICRRKPTASFTSPPSFSSILLFTLL